MKFILGMPGCHRCKEYKESHQDIPYVEMPAGALVVFGKAFNVRELPIVIEAKLATEE